MIVADSSVLIALAKIGRLSALKVFGNEVLIGTAVREEVIDAGIAVGALEVHHIQQAMEDQWLKAVNLTTAQRGLLRQLRERTKLDPGELESLVLALSGHALLAIDDKEGRAIATTLGISHVGSGGVLLQAFRLGALSLDEFEESVRRLSMVLWLSPSVVTELLRRARGQP